MNRPIFILALAFMTLRGTAQQSPSLNSSEILLGLQKLNTVGSVLYIAAHPDDENTRLLSYLASERKLRTGYLSITRGDGGQNLIGKEQGEALGLIRTNELLQARKRDGAEQFFTRANDFGYSKTPEETFAIWNRDSILSDMVWVIRKFRPDVIICRFPTTGEGGHGHHTASAILAEEAFDAAADPKRFPNQLKYVSAWQVKRLFWNTFNFGTTNTTAPDQLKIDVGAYNALLGKSHGEIAAESRSMHKSQGFGSAKGRGSSIEYFKLLKGTPVSKDLFEGIDLTWKRFKETADLDKLIASTIKKFNPADPSLIHYNLESIYTRMERKSEDPEINAWKKQKLKELETLILACSGVWFEAYADQPTGVPGEKINITFQFVFRNKAAVDLFNLSYPDSDSTLNLVPELNKLYTFKHQAKLAETLNYSSPYWLNKEHSQGLFTVNDLNLIGTPENGSQVNVTLKFKVFKLIYNISRPLVCKFTDPVKGEVYRPFEILPPATVNFFDKSYLSVNGNEIKMKVRIKANKDNVKGTVVYQCPYNWQTHMTAENSTFSLLKKGDEKELEFTIKPTPDANDTVIQAYLNIDNVNYSKSITRIEYDHIPYQFILYDAKAKLVKLDLKKANGNIGYIPGAGDDVMNCLKQIGYNVTELTDDKLTNENLSNYSAIVTGVRAYNTEPRLQVHYEKLMKYVENGGNLIVQYNTNSRVGPLQAKIGPYPFTISRDRVTDENAAVGFNKRSHPVISVPNQITQKDFEGWIQERGIYFATEYGDNYETIFSMNDAGEKPLEGSLIYTHYGKGNFVYTGLAFFRELPAGVPGAYRLFTNLLSLPKSE